MRTSHILLMLLTIGPIFGGVKNADAICVAAKRSASPACVKGIACRVTQTTKFCHVRVADAGALR